MPLLLSPPLTGSPAARYHAVSVPYPHQTARCTGPAPMGSSRHCKGHQIWITQPVFTTLKEPCKTLTTAYTTQTASALQQQQLTDGPVLLCWESSCLRLAWLLDRGGSCWLFSYACGGCSQARKSGLAHPACCSASESATTDQYMTVSTWVGCPFCADHHKCMLQLAYTTAKLQLPAYSGSWQRDSTVKVSG